MRIVVVDYLQLKAASPKTIAQRHAACHCKAPTSEESGVCTGGDFVGQLLQAAPIPAGLPLSMLVRPVHDILALLLGAPECSSFSKSRGDVYVAHGYVMHACSHHLLFFFTVWQLHQ